MTEVIVKKALRHPVPADWGVIHRLGNKMGRMPARVAGRRPGRDEWPKSAFQPGLASGKTAIPAYWPGLGRPVGLRGSPDSDAAVRGRGPG